MKEIHVLLDDINNYSGKTIPADKYGHYIEIRHTRAEFQRAIESKEDIIFTSQTSALTTTYLIKGYRLFVHMLDDTVEELKLGDNGISKRHIRISHNLEKLVLTGSYGKVNIDSVDRIKNKVFDRLKQQLESQNENN